MSCPEHSPTNLPPKYAHMCAAACGSSERCVRALVDGRCKTNLSQAALCVPVACLTEVCMAASHCDSIGLCAQHDWAVSASAAEVVTVGRCRCLGLSIDEGYRAQQLRNAVGNVYAAKVAEATTAEEQAIGTKAAVQRPPALARWMVRVTLRAAELFGAWR